MVDLREYIHGDRRLLGAELAELIRAGDYSQLEEILLSHLSSSSGELARIAISVKNDDVKLIHWDRISRTHTTQGNKPKNITAIGLDLDLYAGELRPVLLANYYADIELTLDMKAPPQPLQLFRQGPG